MPPSHNISSPPRTDDADARREVGVAFQAFRECWGVLNGLERLAPFLGKTPRKLREWFYRREAASWKGEDLNRRVEDALFYVAAYLRSRSEHWEGVANTKKAEREAQEAQLSMGRKPECTQLSAGNGLAA